MGIFVLLVASEHIKKLSALISILCCRVHIIEFLCAHFFIQQFTLMCTQTYSLDIDCDVSLVFDCLFQSQNQQKHMDLTFSFLASSLRKCAISTVSIFSKCIFTSLFAAIFTRLTGKACGRVTWKPFVRGCPRRDMEGSPE